jgi:hypothetical protein
MAIGLTRASSAAFGSAGFGQTQASLLDGIVLSSLRGFVFTCYRFHSGFVEHEFAAGRPRLCKEAGLFITGEEFAKMFRKS